MTPEQFNDELQRLLGATNLSESARERAIDALFARYYDETEDDEENFWRQSEADAPPDAPDFSSPSVDYETYSEADPNDYDPAEVDGGPDDEDAFFESGEDPEDYDEEEDELF